MLLKMTTVMMLTHLYTQEHLKAIREPAMTVRTTTVMDQLTVMMQAVLGFHLVPKSA
jgi:hypothetical protein